MYDEMKSPEGKYLIYLIDNISDLEKNFENILKDRDFRIKLILFKRYRHFKKDFSSRINKIKIEVNNLNLNKLDTKKMDKISLKLDNLIKEFEEK